MLDNHIYTGDGLYEPEWAECTVCGQIFIVRSGRTICRDCLANAMQDLSTSMEAENKQYTIDGNRR